MEELEEKDRLLAIKITISKLEKEYGKGVIMKLNENEIDKVPSISTGSLSLDLALGIGGLPRGRIIEIFGPESSGKTTLSMHCIAEAQKLGGYAAFVDAEYAFDKSYAEKIGIDLNRLYIAQPDCGEQALEIAENLIRTRAIDVLVIDSVAALVPRAELEGEMGDSRVGVQARLMSQALRKLTGIVSKTNCVCVFINQLRDKIGVLFGSPETTTGGNALKFYSSVRLDIRRIAAIKDGDKILGNRTKVKVVKNKMAPPFSFVEFDILYGKGVSKVGEILDLGVSKGIVQKAGSWFSYNDNKMAQGRDAAKDFLLNNPGIMAEIEQRIRENIGSNDLEKKNWDMDEVEE
ncbi:MAG: recombinase RecA [Cytophagales bacterium]|jgi:recombination protein RecA|nr:recombinase RecA [Cytophagales bacterium]